MARPVAVITGAARGIGLESARRLSATHRVALLDIDATGAEAAAAAIGGDAVWAACDIARADSVAAAVDDVVERCGGIDVAIANAGVAPPPGTILSVGADAWERVLEINLSGVTLVWLPWVAKADATAERAY